MADWIRFAQAWYPLKCKYENRQNEMSTVIAFPDQPLIVLKTGFSKHDNMWNTLLERQDSVGDVLQMKLILHLL